MSSEAAVAALTSGANRLAKIIDGSQLRRVALCSLMVAALAIPLIISSRYGQVLATRAGIYVLIVIGLNLVSGYGGQISIGHGALVAVGAYTAALGMVDLGLNFWLAACLAIVLTTVFGGLMALPALRLSTWYFALVTLGFAEVVGGLLVEMKWLTHGFTGVVGISMPKIGGWSLQAKDFLWLVIVLNILVFIAYRNLVNSRFGRALVAVRVDPAPAIAAGVSVTKVKLMAFALSAGLAGLGGALFAVQKTVVTPDDFTAEFSIFFLLVMVLGGEGRLWGPLLGTIALLTLPTLMEGLSQWRLLVYGVVLLVLILFAPFGLDGAIAAAWARLRVALGLTPERAPLLPARAMQALNETDAANAHALLDRVDGAQLQVRDIVKTFGGVVALNGVQLSVRAGSTHALVGPNGSGKTTLVNVISGFYPPDRGTVLIADIANAGMAAPVVARLGVGRTFQTPRLLPDLSVLENVMLGAYARERALLVELALRSPRANREREQIMVDAVSYLRFVGLGEKLGVPATSLPHGQQRLVEVARALLGRPRLLLLDEPAAGLSLSELDRLADLIRAIKKLGTTVLIVEHHIDLVADICDHVTVLDQGRVLATGTPAEVFKDEAVALAYMGKTPARLSSATQDR